MACSFEVARFQLLDDDALRVLEMDLSQDVAGQTDGVDLPAALNRRRVIHLARIGFEKR